VSVSLHRPSRRTSLVTALLTVLVATVLVVQVADTAAARRERCDTHRQDSLARAGLVTGHGAPVTVIGDSWSVGLGVDGGDSWPTRLPGEVHVAGFSGSGFSRAASRCGPVSYAVRAAAVVPAGAGLVVVEGGLNDTDQPDAAIRTGFEALLRVLEERRVERVVVVGPAPAPARGDAVPRVDRLLAALAAAAGTEYVSAAAWELGYLPDGLHPDTDGHREFGDLVTAALE